MTQFIFLKNPFSTQIKQTASRTKSTKAQSKTSERLPVQQDLPRAALGFVGRPWPSKGDGDRAPHHTPWPSKGEPSSPINNMRGLSLRSQANELVNHRLLTSKLGGWGHGPSSGRESTQQPHHESERRAARQMVSLHAAARTLPSYLIKLVNQLMRHGKKGLSVGLLADSLTLFLKRLEEGERSNPRNNVLETAILSQQMGKQGGIPSREGVIQSKGVPSFPFYLTSFPGASFGDMFSIGNGQSNTLLGLPFSGTLSPDFPPIRLSFLEKDGKYRGSLGFERRRNVDAEKDQSLPVLFDIPLSASAPAFWAGSRNRRPINLKTWIVDTKQNPISTSHLSRVEVGLRSHTQKPIYFWHMKGSPTLPLRLNSSESGKVQKRLYPAQPYLVGREGIAPQASILDSLSRAIAHVEPSLEIRKKKIAGITRQIPCVVSKSRGERLAIRWIITSARERVKKRGKGLPYCLAEELTDAYHKRGEPRQKRDSLHKAAESNRSFLRYRWW